ncbi:MAG TPA: Calx-beta domain-containing protein, partial [Azospira sp.]|nr:Calx-beta domain-containing protein [Azospira sp.]
GELTGIINIPILGDSAKEGDELFNLVLSNPSGAGFSSGDSLIGTGTIVDDEPLLSIGAPKLIEGKTGDKANMQFIVALSQAASQDVVVKYATANSTAKNAASAGKDYVATKSALTIKAGELTGIINIPILGDSAKEGDELFNLVLSNPSGAGFSSGDSLIGTGTIVDDEPTVYFVTAKPISMAAPRTLEGKVGEALNMQFVVTLSQTAAQDVTFDYATANSTAKNAATSGTDYAATSGSLTIKAGEVSGVINIPLIGDAIKEGDELFNLILSNPSGAGFASGTTLIGIGTIVDDEAIIYSL